MIEFEKGKEGPRQIPTAERLPAKLNSGHRKEETFRQLVLECLGILCDRYGQMVSALEQMIDVNKDHLSWLKRTRERVI